MGFAYIPPGGGGTPGAQGDPGPAGADGVGLILGAVAINVDTGYGAGPFVPGTDTLPFPLAPGATVFAYNYSSGTTVDELAQWTIDTDGYAWIDEVDLLVAANAPGFVEAGTDLTEYPWVRFITSLTGTAPFIAVPDPGAGIAVESYAALPHSAQIPSTCLVFASGDTLPFNGSYELTGDTFKGYTLVHNDVFVVQGSTGDATTGFWQVVPSGTITGSVVTRPTAVQGVPFTDLIHNTLIKVANMPEGQQIGIVRASGSPPTTTPPSGDTTFQRRDVVWPGYLFASNVTTDDDFVELTVTEGNGDHGTLVINRGTGAGDLLPDGTGLDGFGLEVVSGVAAWRAQAPSQENIATANNQTTQLGVGEFHHTFTTAAFTGTIAKLPDTGTAFPYRGGYVIVVDGADVLLKDFGGTTLATMTAGNVYRVYWMTTRGWSVTAQTDLV